MNVPAKPYFRGVPTQMDVDGLNRIPISFEACCDTGGTTALTRSALRIGLG